MSGAPFNSNEATSATIASSSDELAWEMTDEDITPTTFLSTIQIPKFNSEPINSHSITTNARPQIVATTSSKPNHTFVTDSLTISRSNTPDSVSSDDSDASNTVDYDHMDDLPRREDDEELPTKPKPVVQPSTLSETLMAAMKALAPPANIALWSRVDVCYWLLGLNTNYEPYLDAFYNAKITGQRLLSAETDDENFLAQLGITSKLHRKTIMREILRLKNPTGFEEDEDEQKLNESMHSEDTPRTPQSSRSPLQPIAQSCLRLAALRAEESERPDALVKDPLAKKLAGGLKVNHAPFICRKAKFPKPDQMNSTVTEHDAAASGAVDSSSTSAATTHSKDYASIRAEIRASMATEVEAFNQAREEAPDTMIRCRYVDEAIEEYVKQYGIKQLVLLGAGLDTRAYRLSCLKNSIVFELDVPDVINYKLPLLADEPLLAHSIHRVPVDFGLMGGQVAVSKSSFKKRKIRDEPISPLSAELKAIDSEANASTASATTATASSSATSITQPPWLISLLAANFDPSLPTLWIAEGLLMYLGVNQVSNLLSWMSFIGTTSSASHYLVADLMNENTVRSKLKWYRYFRWGAARTGTQPQAIQPFMRANGWKISLIRPPTSNETDESTSAEATDAAAYHIHPIGRDGLSYGRYLQPPIYDSTTRPNQPPMLLESYIIRAELLNINRELNPSTSPEPASS